MEGAWEVGVTELLYTHTFYEPPRFTLTTADRTWSVSNGARLDGGTHFITIAEEQYPGYYDLFEHVFEAMVASFEGVPVVEASRGPEQFRWVLQPRTKMHLPFASGVCGSYHRGGGMWEFTNYDVEDWMASYFPREHYINKRYRRLVLEMRETLKEVGIKTGLGPGIDIVDLRDRFYVTMSPGASLRFSLPMLHMFGFVDDNFALMSQYKDGRFQIQHDVQRMSLAWVQQPGLPLRFEIAPPHGTANYDP